VSQVQGRMSLNIEYPTNDKVVIVISGPRDGRRSGGRVHPPLHLRQVAISPRGSTYTRQASGRELLSHMSICHGRALSRTQSYHMGWKKRRWKSLAPLVRGTYANSRFKPDRMRPALFHLNRLEHHEDEGKERRNT